MPIKLAAPLIKDFPLERSDLARGVETEPTIVTIIQASQGGKERRSLIHSEVTQVVNSESVLHREMQLRQKWSLEQLKRIEVFLTLVGCNIQDVDGQPLFKFKTDNGIPSLAMSEEEFRVAFYKLDPDVADEIHEKVLEVNVSWQGPLES